MLSSFIALLLSGYLARIDEANLPDQVRVSATVAADFELLFAEQRGGTVGQTSQLAAPDADSSWDARWETAFRQDLSSAGRHLSAVVRHYERASCVEVTEGVAANCNNSSSGVKTKRDGRSPMVGATVRFHCDERARDCEASSPEPQVDKLQLDRLDSNCDLRWMLPPQGILEDPEWELPAEHIVRLFFLGGELSYYDESGEAVGGRDLMGVLKRAQGSVSCVMKPAGIGDGAARILFHGELFLEHDFQATRRYHIGFGYYREGTADVSAEWHFKLTGSLVWDVARARAVECVVEGQGWCDVQSVLPSTDQSSSDIVAEERWAGDLSTHIRLETVLENDH